MPRTFVRRAADGAVRGVNWRFNAWGGEVDGLYAHWEKDDAFAGGLLDTLGFRGYDAAPFVMEGRAPSTATARARCSSRRPAS